MTPPSALATSVAATGRTSEAAIRRLYEEIDDVTLDQAVERIDAWYASHPEYIARVFGRGSRYLHHIAEMLEARPLDYGHWSAHKLESMSEFRIRR